MGESDKYDSRMDEGIARLYDLGIKVSPTKLSVVVVNLFKENNLHSGIKVKGAHYILARHEIGEKEYSLFSDGLRVKKTQGSELIESDLQSVEFKDLPDLRFYCDEVKNLDALEKRINSLSVILVGQGEQMFVKKTNVETYKFKYGPLPMANNIIIKSRK
jgi:hypothetical protein